MNNKNEIIKIIHDNHLETYIWKYLNGYMEKQLTETKDILKERTATIRAISKINQNKNDAISALCE